MKIIFLGGDERQKYAAEYLKNKGLDLDTYFGEGELPELWMYDVVILPLPVSRDGITLNIQNITFDAPKLSYIFSAMKNDALLVGGNFSPPIKKILGDRKIRYIDYFENEDFQLKNAVLSAEGALFYAMQAVNYSIFGSKTAVVGYGRIGKLLADYLKALGADVTVCARRNEVLEKAKKKGFDILQIKYEYGFSSLCELKNCNMIFNTVPSWVFEEFSASQLRDDTLVLELASPPFGIDGELVKKYNLNYQKALGIPGRYSPKSAGEIVGQTVMIIIEKEGMHRC